MVFRIIDNVLYRVKYTGGDEAKFVETQSTNYVKYIRVSNDRLPKIPHNAKEYFLLEGDTIVPDWKKINNDLKNKRYKRLEKIFTDKWLGIKRIIIDKPYMTDEKAINAQIESYDKLGQVAKKQLKSEPNNPTLQAIVNRWEKAQTISFNANLLTQQIRGVLESKIENNDENIDELLRIAEDIKLNREQLADSSKLNEIKSLFT